MAREPIDVIKAQVGLMVVEIAVLTSELEKARERVKELEGQLKHKEK